MSTPFFTPSVKRTTCTEAPLPCTDASKSFTRLHTEMHLSPCLDTSRRVIASMSVAAGRHKHKPLAAEHVAHFDVAFFVTLVQQWHACMCWWLEVRWLNSDIG